MIHTVDRGKERLAVASFVLQSRLDYLEKPNNYTATEKAAKERSILRWVLSLLNRDVNRPMLEHARWTPMPDEADTDLLTARY